jgi:hypothetical protein
MKKLTNSSKKSGAEILKRAVRQRACCRTSKKFENLSSSHHDLEMVAEITKFRKFKTGIISTKWDVFFQPMSYPWRLLTPNHLHARWSCCPYGPSIVRCQEVRVGGAYRKLEVFRARGKKKGNGK